MASDPLYTELPDWVGELRPAQIDATEQILDAYARGKRVVILEAPTGTGKSLIAEMVRMRMAVPRGVYAATTKSLQAQIQRDFKSAVLMGRRNYTPMSVSEGQGVTCEDCTVKREGDGCMWCQVVEGCPYRIARDGAKGHRLAVLNTAYLLAQIQSGNESQRITSGRGLLVCDEVDELEDQLVGRVEVSVGERWQREWGVEGVKKGAHAATVASWCRTTAEAGRAWALNQPRPPRPVELERRVRGGRELARKLATVGGQYAMDQESWVRDYDDREERRVTLKPVRVGGWGREVLWDRLGEDLKVLAMSATILSGESWCEDVGLTGVEGCEDWEWEMVTVDSGFPVENRPVWMVPAVSMSRGDGWEERWAAMGDKVRLTLGVDKYAGMNTLVHTVSYALGERIVGAIVANPARGTQGGSVRRGQQGPVMRGTTDQGLKVWTYGSASQRDDAMRGYESDGGVLVASSLERGADFHGDLCRLMIVCKLPFPNLGDRRVAARAKGRDGNRWYALQTARALVQMTGRGVRGKDDWADTVVLDQGIAKWWKDWSGLMPRYWRDAVEWVPERVFLRGVA